MELDVYGYSVPRLDVNDNYYSGLESFDGVKDFFNKILLTIDEIKNNLHVFNTLYRGKNINELKDLISIKSDVTFIIDNNEYHLIEEKEIFGISGLKSLPLAADRLPELVKYVNIHTLDYLKKAEVILDRFLVDEDFRKSFIKSTDIVGMKAWRKGMDIEDIMTSFIDLNTITDKIKLKDIIPNLISLKNSRDNLEKAAQETDIYQLKKIEDAINSIVLKVKMIEDNIDTFTGVGGMAISSVADTLSDLGNLVRYHALVYYVTSETAKVLLNIVKTLKN